MLPDYISVGVVRVLPSVFFFVGNIGLSFLLSSFQKLTNLLGTGCFKYLLPFLQIFVLRLILLVSCSVVIYLFIIFVRQPQRNPQRLHSTSNSGTRSDVGDF